MESVENKVVLVTGGAGGIGLALVKELLNNGAKGIAIVDLLEETGLKAVEEFTSLFGPDKAIFIKADITNKKEFEDAFKTTVQTYNQLDIVINNAGVVDEIEWQNTIAVDLVAVIEGSYLAMQKYLPQYKSGPEGLIVNISSILGLRALYNAPIYCVAKHGIVALGQSLGSPDFYNKYKVRVLTLCPGLVRTPLSNTDTSKLLFSDKAKAEFKGLNPVSQSPERVAEALIEIIKSGKNGSLWVTEDDEPVYEIVIPDRKTMRV